MATGKPNGRPPKLTEDQEKEILALVAHGLTIREVAAYLMVSSRTVFRYAKGKDFCHNYKKAKVEGKLRSLSVIAAQKDWTAHAWLLERRWPEQYLKRTQVTHVDRVVPGNTFKDIEHGELAEKPEGDGLAGA